MEKKYPIELKIEDTRGQVGKLLQDSGLSISIVAMILREMAQQATEQERMHLMQLRKQQEQEKDNQVKQAP